MIYIYPSKKTTFFIFLTEEKRKIVKEAIELRDKCYYNSAYQEKYKDDVDNYFNFVIEFNNESVKKYNERLEKAVKLYNQRHKNDNRESSDDERNDSYDEYKYRKYRKEPKYENKKSDKKKKVNLYVCVESKRKCPFCRRKLELKEIRDGAIQAHSNCVQNVKFCIICGNRNNLLNTRSIYKECKYSENRYLYKCFFCKQSWNS